MNDKNQILIFRKKKKIHVEIIITAIRKIVKKYGLQSSLLRTTIGFFILFFYHPNAYCQCRNLFSLSVDNKFLSPDQNELFIPPPIPHHQRSSEEIRDYHDLTGELAQNGDLSQLKYGIHLFLIVQIEEKIFIFTSPMNALSYPQDYPFLSNFGYQRVFATHDGLWMKAMKFTAQQIRIANTAEQIKVLASGEIDIIETGIAKALHNWSQSFPGRLEHLEFARKILPRFGLFIPQSIEIFAFEKQSGKRKRLSHLSKSDSEKMDTHRVFEHWQMINKSSELRHKFEVLIELLQLLENSLHENESFFSQFIEPYLNLNNKTKRNQKIKETFANAMSYFSVFTTMGTAFELELLLTPPQLHSHFWIYLSELIGIWLNESIPITTHNGHRLFSTSQLFSLKKIQEKTKNW